MSDCLDVLKQAAELFDSEPMRQAAAELEAYRAAVATHDDAARGLLPMQPVVTVDGVKRFRANTLVRHLLDFGGLNMNHLARVVAPREDFVQFAQLIGYSVSGFSELSYVSDADFERAANAESASA